LQIQQDYSKKNSTVCNTINLAKQQTRRFIWTAKYIGNDWIIVTNICQGRREWLFSSSCFLQSICILIRFISSHMAFCRLAGKKRKKKIRATFFFTTVPKMIREKLTIIIAFCKYLIHGLHESWVTLFLSL